MEQTGEYRIAAPRAQVWQALNDAEILGQCIAGCQQVEQIDEQHFDVKVKAKVGPVSAVFQAALELTELDPPNSYVIVGNVKGGAAGFAKGSARVLLTEAAADQRAASTDGESAPAGSAAEVDAADSTAAQSTLLSYTVNANVGGKLAQVGSRLVDGAARKMADDFFAAFTALLAPDTPDAPDAPDAAAQPAGAATPGSADAAEQSAGGQWKIWLVAFLALAIAAVLTI